MALNGVDPSAKTPSRLRRDMARISGGAVTSTLNVKQPVTLDGQGNLVLNTATNGGLTGTGVALAIKLDTNPGLQTGAGGLSIKPDTAGPVTLGAGGVSVGVDGVTVETSANVLRLKDGAVTGAKFGWATTKGDMLVYNGTAYVALPVGSNGQVLTADSTAATGVKWA